MLARNAVDDWAALAAAGTTDSRIGPAIASALELEEDGGDHAVREEQQHEAEHDGLVDRVAHALRPALHVESHEAGDEPGEQTEDGRLELAGEEVEQADEQGDVGDELPGA